jgi:hypothetical protein
MAVKGHKQDSNTIVEQPKRKHWGKKLLLGGTALVLIAGGCVAVLNPQVSGYLQTLWTQPSDESVDVYQAQINDLQQQVANLSAQLSDVSYQAAHPDLAAVSERIDNMELLNVNTIKSKADVDTVLGIIGRLDNAEGRLNDLAKVTDDGALILTAAMLVKDAGQRGGTFVYEAEVLSELAAGHHKIDSEVARLNEIAAVGVPTVEDLQRQFAESYLQRYPEMTVEEDDVATDWKGRIYHQLSKVVQIKRTETDKSEVAAVFSEEDRAWSVVRDYVMQGDIAKAVAIVKKPLNAKVAEDKILADWLKHAEIYCDFYDSVSRISANALAVMKVKFLRGEK